MEDETTWVVLTGKPKKEDRKIMIDEQAWALNPWIGLTLYNFVPRVFMIRHPPELIPKAKAKEQAKTTHKGT
jgi:hypothetical protein